MKQSNGNLREPLTFLIGILLLEGLFGILVSMGAHWAGVLLFILISSIQIVTLMLIWYVFRLLLRMNDRLRQIETNTKDGSSNKS